MAKALIFDLFGVLIDFDDDIVYRRLAKHCAKPEDAFFAMRGLVSREALIQGQLTLEELHRQLVAEQGLTLTLRTFEDSWHEPYSRPMPGMSDLIRDVSKRHSLVLLSNVDRYYWQVVRSSHPELDCFAAFSLSWESGVSKPDHRAFRQAVSAARTSADRCFFIDDKAENIEAGLTAGLRGHRFTDVDALRDVLDHEGFL